MDADKATTSLHRLRNTFRAVSARLCIVGRATSTFGSLTSVLDSIFRTSLKTVPFSLIVDFPDQVDKISVGEHLEGVSERRIWFDSRRAIKRLHILRLLIESNNEWLISVNSIMSLLLMTDALTTFSMYSD